MNSERMTARISGILFLTAIITGVISVVFLKPIINVPDYLVRISANENRVMMGTLFELLMAGACAGIAISLYPILKKYNEGLALGSVSFRLIEAILFIFDSIAVLTLLNLSQEFAKGGVPDVSHIQTLGNLLLSVRYWAGSVFTPFAFGLGALMYYYIFYRSNLLPRWLSIWGIIAILLQLAAAILVISGEKTFSTITLILNLPIFLNELVLAAWLISVGFNSSAIVSQTA